MARETKAQRQERLAVEEASRIEVDTKNYPGRLMYILELACEMGYKLTASNGMFCVSDDSNVILWQLSLSYTNECRYVLDLLEQQVDYLVKEKEEEQRKDAVKAAALAKLTPEEKELLGL